MLKELQGMCTFVICRNLLMEIIFSLRMVPLTIEALPGPYCEMTYMSLYLMSNGLRNYISSEKKSLLCRSQMVMPSDMQYNKQVNLQLEGGGGGTIIQKWRLPSSNIQQ